MEMQGQMGDPGDRQVAGWSQPLHPAAPDWLFVLRVISGKRRDLICMFYEIPSVEKRPAGTRKDTAT